MQKKEKIRKEQEWKEYLKICNGVFMCQQCGFETRDEKLAIKHQEENIPDKNGLVHVVELR